MLFLFPLKCSRQFHATEDLEELFMSEMYGYIRVSTREQNDDRQRTALENFGVSAKIFLSINRVAKILRVRNIANF